MSEKPVHTSEEETTQSPVVDVLTTEQLEQKLRNKQNAEPSGDKSSLDLVPGNRRKFL